MAKMAVAPRILRDFARLLSLVKAVAILRHNKRQLDSEGRIIAELADYETVRELVADMYIESTSGAVSSIRQLVEAVRELVKKIEERRLPMLLDADGLKSYPRRVKTSTGAVFTPHEKEFEILTGKVPGKGLEKRGETVRKEASRLGATILLKGNVDVVSDGEKTRYNWTGNPGMTVGGTGDVLSGVVAGFMAMGCHPFQAAVAGAFVNGAAGDAALYDKGYHLEPLDLVRRIPLVMEDAMVGRLRPNLDRQ